MEIIHNLTRADGSGRMLPPRNAGALTVLPLVIMSTAVATAAEGPGDPAAAPTVDWAHVERAHALLEKWVRGGAMPPAPLAESMRVAGVAGVKVTLRWSGRTMGSGEVTSPILPAPPVIDLVETAREAGARALRDVERAIVRRRPAGSGSGDDTASAGALAQIASALMIDLQVAWKPEPIVLPRHANAAHLTAAYAPGYHGLVAHPRHPGAAGGTSWVWPATSLAMNLRPQGQVRYLLGERASAGDATREDGLPTEALRFFRFQVIHYVRPAPHQPRMRLTRGNLPLPPRAIVGADVDAVTAMMTDHLLARLRQDGSFAGTYHPTNSRFEPTSAIAGEAALATYVLTRRLRHLCPLGVGGSTSPVPPSCRTLREAIARAIRHQGSTLADPRATLDPSAAALMVLATVEMSDMPDAKVYRDRIAACLLSLQSDDGTFRVAVPAAARRVRPTTQSLILLALSATHRQTRDATLAPALTRGRRALWNTVNRETLISTLPWTAMLAHAGPPSRDDAAPGGDDRDRQRHPGADFAYVDRQLAGMQINDATLRPHDVFGGYSFDTTAQPWPTADWRTAAMLAYTAVRLRHAENDASTRRDALIACGRAARFLAQLMIDEPSCYYGLDAAAMIGGVRSALWDNRLGLDRTSMALLALTELQTTLAEWTSSAPDRTAQGTDAP